MSRSEKREEEKRNQYRGSETARDGVITKGKREIYKHNFDICM